MPEAQNQIPQTSGQKEAAPPQFAPLPVSIGLPWRLMTFSFVLFLLSIFVFVGLRFGYGTYLDAQTADLDQRIEDLTAQVSESEQEELLLFYSQLVNLEKVLDGRLFTSNIFPFLEANTLSLVYYTEAQYSGEDGMLSLSGIAGSMQTFVEQMTVFESAPETERLIISDVGLKEGDEVTFSVRMAFQPQFFRQLR